VVTAVQGNSILEMSFYAENIKITKRNGPLIRAIRTGVRAAGDSQMAASGLSGGEDRLVVGLIRI
jgi:predicted RNA-binding protein YlqC (UPF0109 family)